jgi:hypothetical protein
VTTYAIAIGNGAVASATGLFGGSLAIGDNAQASMSPFNLSAFNFATAIGNDAIAQGFTTLFGVATQIGPGTAITLGFGNIAVGLGEGTGQSAAASGFVSSAWQLGPGSAATLGTLSIAVGVGKGKAGQTSTSAGGFASLALNLLGGASADGISQVSSNGFFSAAVNILGDDNEVTAAAPSLPGANLALNIFGKGNTVSAGPGPLAFAGSIFQRGATVTKVGPGFNINGLAVPGVASVQSRSVAPATATAAPTARHPTAKAVSPRTPRKTTR